MLRFTVGVVLLVGLAYGEKAGVRLDDLPVNQETSITIGKGHPKKDCIVYELVEGREDVFGSPEFDKSKALSSWKLACNEWRQNLKELNKDNRVISINCSRPAMSKEGEQYLYKSSGIYKVRVKMREPAG